MWSFFKRLVTPGDYHLEPSNFIRRMTTRRKMQLILLATSFAILPGTDANAAENNLRSLRGVLVQPPVVSNEASPADLDGMSEDLGESSFADDRILEPDTVPEINDSSDYRWTYCDLCDASYDESSSACDSLWNERPTYSDHRGPQWPELDVCHLFSHKHTTRPLVTASMMVNQYYTDNVFYVRPLWFEPRREDWVTVFLPSLNYRFENSREVVNLGGSAEIGRYATYGTEDYEDFALYANGTHRINELTRAAWGTRVARDHEPRNSIEPSVAIGPVPPVYWWISQYGAVSRQFGDNTVKVGFTFDRYDFVDSGGFDYKFRDRNMVTTGARLTHQRSESTSVYAEGTLDFRDYDFDNLFLRPDRDSRGVRAALGWQEYLGDVVDLELYGGVIYQTFDSELFDDVVAADYGGDLSWQPMLGTSISIRAQRRLEETTLFDTSSYLATSVSLQFEQIIKDDFRIYSGVAASMFEFQGTAREDQLTNAWIGFRKYVTPTVFIGGEAAYEERESNTPVNDYAEARIMARIGIERDDTLIDENISVTCGIDNAELYFGTRGGVTSLMTLLDGERQPGQNGNLTTDFGDFGLTGDLVGGLGLDIDRWYVGLEAEAGLSDARWDHSRLPGGRVFSVKREESFGGAFLAGRRLCSSALVYGRAGVRASTFDTQYASAGSSTLDTDSRFGLEYGIGTRVPVSDHFSIGMEYVHAVLDDYSMGPGNGTPDAFANSESTARISGTYHFNAPRRSYAVVAQDFSGAYWGLQIGHGGLSSLTNGNRAASSVLNADFGDTGFTGGLLVGYNHQSGILVCGAELDADLAQQEWNHDRQPSGRNFSLEKTASAGASLRAGAVLSDAALVYGRVGVTGSYFDIDFSNSGGTANSEDCYAGLRYGGGLEVPVNDAFAWRFDYTFTDYGTLSLSTSPGVETYRTTESLCRVGVVVKR